MAQKTEKEETEFKVPETLTPCINNCGIIGNPATNNMCQKCLNDTAGNNKSTATGGGVVKFKSRSSPIRLSEEPDLSPKVCRKRILDRVTAVVEEEEERGGGGGKREVNRCSGCRRRVGLAGFHCRCGELFCWEHRYSDRHDCSYDYKAAGRESIARENPVIKAAKIVRV